MPTTSLVDALKARYGAVDETTYDADAFLVGDKARRRNKTWEMVGMEKTRLKQAQHSKLVHVVLRDCNIDVAQHDEREIDDQQLVRVQELDLSQNVALTPAALDTIVQHLPALQVLQVSDVPLFSATIEHPLHWGNLRKLVLNNTGFLHFGQVASMLVVPQLQELHLDGNGISRLAEGPIAGSGWALPSVTVLSLAGNSFSSWVDSGLNDVLPHCFPALTSLFLTNNGFPDPDEADAESLSFLAGLRLLCVHENKRIVKPESLVCFRRLCPKLETFRITYAYLYPSINETLARMMVVASLPTITTLNRAAVRAKERLDSELFYVQRGLSETNEEKRRSWYPFTDELRQKHADVVVALIKEGETASTTAHVMLEVRLRCDGFEDCRKTVPSSLQIGKLKSLIRSVFGVEPCNQDLGYWSGDAALATLPTPLDNELQSLAYFGVGSGAIIRVRDTSLR